jgi:aldehyde:ferredoxin oxidoreductase
VPIDKMLPRYYQLRGWDENGVPTKKTLKKLGLDFINL